MQNNDTWTQIQKTQAQPNKQNDTWTQTKAQPNKRVLLEEFKKNLSSNLLVLAYEMYQWTSLSKVNFIGLEGQERES